MHRSTYVFLLAVLIQACGGSTSPNVASNISTSSGGQVVTVGSVVTATVRVTNSQHAPVAGVVVTWSAAPNEGALGATTSTSDATGSASVQWTVDTLVGIKTISASIPGASPITISENVSAAPAVRFYKISGDSQVVALHGAMLPLTVGVSDRYGNPIAGAFMTWLSTCNFDTFTGGGTSDPFGRAALSIAFGPNAGTCTVTVTTTSVPGTTILFTATGS
jgi:hypothetical protein